ncbi:hypothetical protein GR316_04565 [Falsirhodobacter algicola]|uniref:Uncharacterized protein n=2 Tax=Falsirhodobacter algicola TaxID=2692330 RepID=A0A8J8SLX6_9RHOB|nr:hypothetical protein GR316_04565 [Falsirhodobacter algicola]
MQRMIMRMFMMKVMTKGIDYAARRGKDPATMTAEERAQAQSARGMAKRAQKIARITRRMR